MSVVTYTPRNDFVLVRLDKIDVNRAGIAIPQRSAQSMKFFVVATGPDVKNLEVGDRIIIVAKENEGDYYPLPNDNSLFAIRERFVAFTVQEKPEVI
jgi:hypothetical protein